MSLEPAFIVVDKEPGITSHDVVAMVRAVTGIRKVGHTGTLDPFARGVLPVALGSATRLIQFLDESYKEYDAVVALGASTDTGDPTGTVVEELPVPTLEPAVVEEVLAGFVGDRMQEPPRYSAVKVKGKRLYQYARAGEEVRAEPRPIRIHELKLLALEPGRLRILLGCSRGTYARVLADEIARALGTAGHLESLVRTRSGPFVLDQAISMAALAEVVVGDADWQRGLAPSRGEDRVPWRPRDDVLADLQRWRVPPLQALGNHRLLPVSPPVAEVLARGGPLPAAPPGVRPGERFVLVSGEDMVAIAESQGGGRSQAVWRASSSSSKERKARRGA